MLSVSSACHCARRTRCWGGKRPSGAQSAPASISLRASSRWHSSTATTSGVFPSAVAASRSAPAARHADATTPCPPRLARKRGVTPPTAAQLTSAPADSSASTARRLPVQAAKHSGVTRGPLPVEALPHVSAGSASSVLGGCRSKLTRRRFADGPPPQPSPPCASGRAPASSSSFTRPEWPCFTATQSGVSPAASGVSSAAPAATSAVTTAACPFRTASDSGVLPAGVRCSSLAPPATSASTTARWPCRQASEREV
mmetsp:Transcript_45143/g.115488  ORF Transcript_45143/g.115488 Transcript_45143/m.115488 type:complete len:256 (+) Transcript_45143:285-1052(+)